MEVDLDQLRKDLAALEAEEARVSAERRNLHRQIDFGFATETTRAREREVSDRRRELHGRIDELRERLNLPTGPRQPLAEHGLEPIGGEGSGGLERIGDR
jgi:chromosome segregation ATPase